MNSPYAGLPQNRWVTKTRELLESHPLKPDDIVQVVLEAWQGILMTEIAGKLRIGSDVFPSPQILGNYLHELIPLGLQERYPDQWRKGIEKEEKDLVCISDSFYSAEIKTSSSVNGIFGNRSYGQLDNKSGKDKSGFYIAVNFQKFKPRNQDFVPQVRKIRFGWLDHEDWIAQAAPTGQQSRPSLEARDNKLIVIYDNGNS